MSDVNLAVRGGVPARGTARWRALFDRSTSADDAIRDRTAGILARVRRDGDDALRALALEFDGVALESLEVPRRLWRRALDSLDPALRRALERAAENIGAVHRAFRPAPQSYTTADGVVITRRPDPLARVGVYAPGGRATYPSSLLMGVVPAKVAGVGEVIVCSPPGRDGKPSAVLLAAAEIAGADRVFAIGGAGAIAAMAWGTQNRRACRSHRRPGQRVRRGGEAAGRGRRGDRRARRAERAARDRRRIGGSKSRRAGNARAGRARSARGGRARLHIACTRRRRRARDREIDPIANRAPRSSAMPSPRAAAS